MSEWKKVKLKNICSDIIDCVNKTAPVCDYETPYKMLRTSDIRNGQINTEGLKCVSKETFEKWNRRGYLQKGDVIFTREAPVGEVGWLKDPKNLFLGQRLMFFRADNKKCDNRFLFYSLFFSENKRSIIAKSNGSTVNHLRVPDCENIEIDIPDLQTQQNIASILSRYDSLIENYQKQIKLLEEAAQRLYKEWFVDLHFPGHENTKIVDGVPEGWEKKKLEDIFSYVRGRSYTSKELSDSGTILVNLKNIQAFGGYKRDAEKRYLGDYKQEQSLEVGDLIMGVTDMTQERRLVGHVALIPEFKEPATFSMDLIKILPFELSKSFLYCAMRFGGISKQIAPLANGVNVLHLKPEAMMGIGMVVPSKELIKHFDDYYNHGFNTILHLQDQIRLLTEARDRLLPKLMSGEIAV